VLSAADLKAITNWPDPVIEDYLNILRNFASLSESIDDESDRITDTNNSIAIAHVQPIKYTTESFVVSADHETAGDEKIICINTVPITIALSDSPENLEEVVVQRSREQVTVDGAGLLINDDTEVVLDQQYVSLTFIFSSELGGWVIV